MTAAVPEPACQTVSQYLQQRLQARLAPAARQWLADKCGRLERDASPLALYAAFGAAPRTVGRAPLGLDESERAQADVVRPRWRPGHWSVDQAVRCLLLLAHGAAAPDAQFATLEKLFSTADAGELVALYQALAVLPRQDRYRMRAAEGVRSNLASVFHAVALHNPYPFEQFDEAAWNQMVLKVAFTGAALQDVIGLQARANTTLARMLRDLVHERHAAARGFPAEVWHLMAPYADAGMIDDLRRTRDGADPSHRAAAAAALAAIGRSD